ncbi:putative geranyl diphosphate diphosphatase [Helianthus annuus]|uniref:Geranyl diphosphate diphosphatase n=1 Tax=Helianthus annuus TaxID=4232 RepID=A0A251TRI2_HELAN|nr:probable terpene synthase 11 [Helianthus annuus]KAF5788771.1 putative geranyl diphosphate diphosphatase [Helianthus annuus]
MTSQLFSVNLSSKANVVSSSNEWRLVSYSSCKSSSRVFRFPVLPRATIAISTTQGNDFLLVKPQLVISSEGDVRKRIHNLKENTRRALMTASNPAMKLKLVDMIQRLGLGYIFEEDIKIMLETLAHGQPDDDLYTVALRFRILRHNGLHPNPDVFGAFMDANGKFGESLVEDTEGLLSLYEASYLGANGEDILSQAKEFTTTHLKKSVSRFTHKLGEQILESFEIPRHLRMVRLEARRYIEEYGKDIDHTPVFLQLAKLEYNQVQSLHQMELAELSRWWRDLGLASKLTFARDRPIECFLWSVGLLPEPKYSTVRIELAKTVSILLVIDDVFDTYGTYDDLVLFTKAIQRWDVDEIEQLPEYMKICYMALHNTTNEICDVVHKNHGLSVLPYLRKAWIDTIQAFMVEAEWVKRGYEPDLKDYIDNGITTAGTYMALVHLFFLMGEGVTPKNMSSLLHSYPPFFTHAGKILRLWDDLGTSKEEQERGDIASSVQLLMKEKNIKSEEDGRKQILELIQTSWKELNEALVAPNIFPFSIVNVALNMSRASQVVYQHDDGNSYFSSVDDHARSLFFTPIDM